VTARAPGDTPSERVPDSATLNTRTEKAQWRRRIRAARLARDPEQRARDAELLTAAVLRLADGIAGPVCAHLPVGVEPWSVTGVEALAAAGHEVLVPVVADRSGPLDWARFTGPDALAPGPFGLREPVGPRLGPAAVGRAHLVLLPALAADRRGVRLGQGGGFYDRTLPLVGSEILLVVVLGDGELVDALPTEPHDRLVSAAVLPGTGVTMLGGIN
jgi:5-formyltetrahydrofolate cyclo-ligase